MTNVKLYWKHDNINEKTGYMDQIVLPDGEVHYFNHEEQLANFTALEPYVGTPCEYYLDGEHQWTANLRKIDVVPGADYGRPDIEELRCLRFGPAL